MMMFRSEAKLPRTKILQEKERNFDPAENGIKVNKRKIENPLLLTADESGEPRIRKVKGNAAPMLQPKSRKDSPVKNEVDEIPPTEILKESPVKDKVDAISEPEIIKVSPVKEKDDEIPKSKIFEQPEVISESITTDPAPVTTEIERKETFPMEEGVMSKKIAEANADVSNALKSLESTIFSKPKLDF